VLARQWAARSCRRGSGDIDHDLARRGFGHMRDGDRGPRASATRRQPGSGPSHELKVSRAARRLGLGTPWRGDC
jgi:hypothetical protein